MTLESYKPNSESILVPLRWLYVRLVKDGFPKIAVCVAGIFISIFIMEFSYVSPQIVSDYVAILGFCLLGAFSALLIVSISMVVFGRRKRI